MANHIDKHYICSQGDVVASDYACGNSRWGKHTHTIIQNQKINAHMEVMVTAKLWSLNLLEGWLSTMNTAVEKIEPLKTSNPKNTQEYTK